MIVTEQVVVAVAEFWSVTFAPKLKLPAAEGVPCICPAAPFSDKPPGSCPLPIVHVYGGAPPEALSVMLNGCPTVPLVAGQTAAVNPAEMAMERGAVALPCALSVTRTLKEAFTAVVGVPEICPLLLFKVNPAGKEPDESPQV